jgi:hypothetical protein
MKMTYSSNLNRQIPVEISKLNRFDEAELEAALIALPGWPDMSGDDIRDEAKAGNLNAELIITRAEAGDLAAKSYLG